MASATGIEARPRRIWNAVGEAPLSESTGKTSALVHYSSSINVSKWKNNEYMDTRVFQK